MFTCTSVSSLHQSVCNSSKVPLHGIFTVPTSSQLKEKKDKQTADASTSVGLEKKNKSLFSNLTISPLRKFQLLDSDSDEPSSCDNQSRKGYEVSSSLNKPKSTFGLSATVDEKKKSLTASITQKEDLWKDFCQTKNFHLPTPAFDEVCKEFSQLKKDNKAATELGSSAHISCMDNHTTNSGYSNELVDKLGCPAHYYFFHNDPRIQRLVRNRLPNFSPLGVDGSRGSMIDYVLVTLLSIIFSYSFPFKQICPLFFLSFNITCFIAALAGDSLATERLLLADHHRLTWRKVQKDQQIYQKDLRAMPPNVGPMRKLFHR